mmetsp:Transcript_31935/g.55024  ORF Transcript_31935/g.55024 Transcript_31935/m.55024 type:complete len:573 (-) Transcript_31935:1666-3384(-)
MHSDDKFGLLFFVLGLTYFSMFCLTSVRTFKLHRFNKEWRHAQYLYIALLLHTSLRSLSFVSIFFSIAKFKPMDFFLLLSIPDITFIACFLFLVWQFITVFYYSHFEAVMEESLLAQVNKKPQQSAATRFGVFFMILWIGLQISMTCAMIFDYIKMFEITREMGIANLIIPTLVLGLMLYLHIKFSGSPTRSHEWKSKLKKISTVTLIWALLRYFQGVIYLIPGYNNSSIAKSAGNDKNINFIAVMLMICQLIFSEIFCLVLVFDYKFMTIFLFEPQAPPDLRKRSDSFTSSEELRLVLMAKFPDCKTLKEDDLRLTGTLQTKADSFGQLFKAKYLTHDVVLRKVSFSRLSGYVLEEISTEFERLAALKISSLLPLVGVYIQTPVLGVVHPFMERGSLHNVLHVSQVTLSFYQKILIARQIANCMTRLHRQKVYHGHLSSHNVMIDRDWTAYVGDVGLLKAKKYAGHMFGYCNKTAWSSPEQLNEKSLTSSKVSPADDVYSFGMILWELMVNQPPFPDMNRMRLIRHVAIEQQRPLFPPDILESLEDLISMCWHKDPGSRPTFESIIAALNS